MGLPEVGLYTEPFASQALPLIKQSCIASLFSNSPLAWHTNRATSHAEKLQRCCKCNNITHCTLYGSCWYNYSRWTVLSFPGLTTLAQLCGGTSSDDADDFTIVLHYTTWLAWEASMGGTRFETVVHSRVIQQGSFWSEGSDSQCPVRMNYLRCAPHAFP